MNFKDVCYYVLIFAVIGFMLFTMSYIVKYKEAYFDNPFVFGANRMGGVDCSCFQMVSGQRVPFNFNDSGFFPVELRITYMSDYDYGDSSDVESWNITPVTE